VLQAIGAVDDTLAVDVTVRDRAGRERTVRVDSAGPGFAMVRLRPPAGAAAPAPAYLQDTAVLSFRPIADTRAVHLLYNAVAEPAGETTAEFAARLKDALRERGATDLVVDLRNNGGGNTYLYPPLLNAIVHFRESAPGNRVWVIVGRHTFSAAQNFATTLERYITDATFVGEPSGSRPNFVGESPPVVLPYSGLRASISSRYHQNVDFTDRRQWIAPRVPAPLSSADYFANRDPALDAVVRLLTRPQP
jgi:hypothetical protein